MSAGADIRAAAAGALTFAAAAVVFSVALAQPIDGDK